MYLGHLVHRRFSCMTLLQHNVCTMLESSFKFKFMSNFAGSLWLFILLPEAAPYVSSREVSSTSTVSLCASVKEDHADAYQVKLCNVLRSSITCTYLLTAEHYNYNYTSRRAPLLLLIISGDVMVMCNHINHIITLES